MSGAPPGLSTRRDFEHWLRRNGFSKARSRELAVHGWRDQQQDDIDAVRLLRALAARLEIEIDGKNVSE